MLKNRRITRRGIVMAVVAGLLLPASLAFADHVTGVASYTACVNRRGEVYNLTQGTNTAEACRGDDTKVHLSGGDITAVTPGAGLAGGGPEGDVTLSVDPAVVQSRVTGQCTVGSAIQSVNQDGTVTCQPTGAAPTHLNDTESVFGANLDLPTNPVVCQTTDHTPTTATVARIDSWAALEGTGLMSYTVRNVVSTNGGATWISLDPEFARDSTPAVGQWGHAANSSIRNLVAGTTYRFGVMLGLDNGPNPSAGRCEVMVEIG